jgi:hypothetical protein
VKVVFDNLANFLSNSPNQTKFFRLFAWSQLEFPAIPVSISAVSFFKRLSTYMLLDFKGKNLSPKIMAPSKFFCLQNLNIYA